MRKLWIAVLCMTALMLSACGGVSAGAGPAEPGGAVSAPAAEAQPEPERAQPAEEEPVATPGEAAPQPEAVLPLTDAPELALVWEDGSETPLSPSDYSWNYPERGEMVSIIACGIAPTDAVGWLDPIVLPDLFRDCACAAAECTLRCVVPPDQVTVRCWDGEAEQPAISQTYDGETGIELDLPHDAYEIAAVWSEEKLEENGFYGEASYIFCLKAP